MQTTLSTTSHGANLSFRFCVNRTGFPAIHGGSSLCYDVVVLSVIFTACCPVHIKALPPNRTQRGIFFKQARRAQIHIHFARRRLASAFYVSCECFREGKKSRRNYSSELTGRSMPSFALRLMPRSFEFISNCLDFCSCNMCATTRVLSALQYHRRCVAHYTI